MSPDQKHAINISLDQKIVTKCMPPDQNIAINNISPDLNIAINSISPD